MKKPFSCKIGIHSYETVAHRTSYIIEMRCSRCGRSKMVVLISSREKR